MNIHSPRMQQQQQSSCFNIPFANRFCPTDCELLYLLYNKVNGLPLPGGSVQDCDLYGSQEPGEIWEMYGGGKSEDLYFFTALKKKSVKGKGKGKRISRTIGSGTWQGEDGPKEIRDETERLVGWKKRFRYEKTGSEHNGGFIMLEYTLFNHDEVVLCRIKKNREAATLTVCGRKRKRNVEEVEEAKPFAYRFCPTDCDLLYFLYNKVNGLPLPGGSVQDCDLYGSQEPWEIWEMYGGGRLEDLYFFTVLKKKSAKGKRICRRIGSGTWQGEDGPKEIRDETEKLIGWKKRFRYEQKGSELHNGGFIMHEYTLLDHDEVVLCRIKKNKEAATKTVCGRKRKKNVEEVKEAEEQLMPVPSVAGAEDHQRKLLADDGDQRDVLESEYEWVTFEQLFPDEDDHQFPSTSTFVHVEEDEERLMPVPVVAAAEDNQRKLLAGDGDQRNVLESEYDWVTLEQLFRDEDDHQFPSTSTFADVEEAEEQLMAVLVAAAEDHQSKLLADDGDQRNVLNSEYEWVTLEQLYRDEDDHQFPSTLTFVDDDLSSILSYIHE